MKRGRGRPRREGADEEILSVAMEMLRESGYRELNVDAIAERAGVAKTTVYRRWPTKAALVSAALPLMASVDVAAVLREVCALLTLLRDADTEVLQAVLEPRRARLRELVGDELTADMLIGPLLITRLPLDDQLLMSIINVVLPAT